MDEVDHLHQNTPGSRILEKKVKMKVLGIHQQEDVVLNQTNDVQQLLEVKEEEVLHLWSSSLDQQDPELLIIKQEEEEQLPVKGEDEKPQFIQLHQIKTEDNRETERPSSSSAEQMKTEPDGEDCGGPEPDRNQDPNAEEKASDSSETENSDEYDEDENNSGSGSMETRTPGSGVESDVGWKSDMKSFSCSERCKQFVNKWSLQKRVTSHSAESTSILVDKKCSGKINVLNSQAVKAKKKPLTCDVCGKTFDYRCRFKRHMSAHTGHKPFACDDCGKTFFYESRLKRHMSIHTGDKLIACDKCGETFRFQYYLQNLTRRHPGAKPFACDDCDKTFKFPHELKYHMIQHTGEKHFYCNKCRKALDLPVVNPHLGLQPSEKPFQCEVCHKKISTKGNLKQHISLHTRENTFA